MAAELRRTHEEQVAGAIRDAAEALKWLDEQGVYLEVHGKYSHGREGYITLDEEAADGSYDAVVIHKDRSRHTERGLTLVGAIESLQERLK